MIINGWDIANANAKQRRMTAGHHSIKSKSEWNSISGRPEFLRSELGFKPVTVDIMVKGNGYEEIRQNTSLILSKLLEVSVIRFDRSEHYFKLVLSKDPKVDQTVKEKWHIVTLEFEGYEYGEEQVITVENSTGFEIDNIGTMATPVTLLITPTASTAIGTATSSRVYPLMDADGSPLIDDDGQTLVGYEETYGGLKISGICIDNETGSQEDILIKNYTTGVTITIDGETGLILEGNVPKIDDVDIWSLPSIKPGLNTIRTNGEFMHIEVRYQPRYL